MKIILVIPDLFWNPAWSITFGFPLPREWHWSRIESISLAFRVYATLRTEWQWSRIDSITPGFPDLR